MIVDADSTQDVARRLSIDLALPDGYKCEYHGNTDNVVVYNSSLGFCVTNVYCRDHSYPEIRAAAAEMLSSLVKETGGIKRFQPTQELLNPRLDTRFDGGLS